MTNLDNFSFDTLLCGTKTDEYYKTHEEEKTLCNIMEIGQVARDIIENKQLSTNKKISLPDVNKIDVIINKKQFITIPSDFTNSIDYFFGDFNGSEHLFILCGPKKTRDNNIFMFLKYDLQNFIQHQTIIDIGFTDDIETRFGIKNHFVNTNFNIVGNDLYFSPQIYSIYLINNIFVSANVQFMYDFLSQEIDGIPNNGIILEDGGYIVDNVNGVLLILYNTFIPDSGIGHDDLRLKTFNTNDKTHVDVEIKNYNVDTQTIILNRKINKYNYLLFPNNFLVIIDNEKLLMSDININGANINDIYLHNIDNDYFYIIHKDNTIYFDHIGEINTIDDFQQEIDYQFDISLEESFIIKNIYLHKNLLFIGNDKTILLYKIDFKNNKSVCLSRNLYTGTNIKSFKVNSDGTCLIINDGNKFISIKFN